MINNSFIHVLVLIHLVVVGSANVDGSVVVTQDTVTITRNHHII
ncbi:hypothetical protein [Bacillus anthracis]